MLHRAPLSVLLEQRLPGTLEDVKHILAAGQLDHVGGNVLALSVFRLPDLPLFFGDVLQKLTLFHQIVGNAAGILDGGEQLLRILLQHLDPALDIGFVQVEMFVQSLLGHLQSQFLGDEGAGDLCPQLFSCVVLTAEAVLHGAVQPVWMAGSVATLMQKGGDVAVWIVEAGLRRQRHHIG